MSFQVESQTAAGFCPWSSSDASSSDSSSDDISDLRLVVPWSVGLHHGFAPAPFTLRDAELKLLRTANSKRSAVNKNAKQTILLYLLYLELTFVNSWNCEISLSTFDFVPPSNFSERKLFLDRIQTHKICWNLRCLALSFVCSFFVKTYVVQHNVSDNLWAQQSCVLQFVGCLGCESYGVVIIIHLLSRQPSWMLRTVSSTFLTHRDVILDAQMRCHSLVQMVLIKCKRDWAYLVKPITRHAWWDNRLW